MKKYLILACFIVFPLLYSGEAAPKFFTFTIKNRLLTGKQFESAQTPVVKDILKNDTLTVDIKTEFQGKGNICLLIPEQAKKLQLFDCVFELPPADVTAYIRIFPLVEIRKPWYTFSKDESQCAILLIYFDKAQRRFNAQLFYRGRSGREVWSFGKKFECSVLPDKKIICPDKKVCDTFFIKDGKLYINLAVTGKYYKYLKKSTCEVSLPHTL